MGKVCGIVPEWMLRVNLKRKTSEEIENRYFAGGEKFTAAKEMRSYRLKKRFFRDLKR
jgi:hypothetical protein